MPVRSPAPARRRRVARVITEATSPAICATAALLAVAASDAGGSLDAVVVSVVIVLVVALPMAFIVVGARRGRWSDHHVGDRAARTVPLLVATAGVAAAVLLLTLADASRAVLAVTVAMLAGLLVVLTVTRWWKVSIHCAVAGGLLAVMVETYGVWWLVAAPFAGIVAWSRVALGDHTAAQAIIGAVLGVCVAATAYAQLR